MNEQEVFKLCGFPGEAIPCTKDCEFYETCTRNPHKKADKNKNKGEVKA